MITERFENTSVTIGIHGIFDSDMAQNFSISVQRAYQMGFRDFYVSLRATTMIDKAGLMLLINVIHQLQQHGCTGTIIHTPSSLQSEFPVRPEGTVVASPHINRHLSYNHEAIR